MIGAYSRVAISLSSEVVMAYRQQAEASLGDSARARFLNDLIEVHLTNWSASLGLVQKDFD